MSNVNPGTPSGTPSERGSNGALGTGMHATSDPAAAGSFADPVAAHGGHGRTRSDRSHRSEFGAFLDDLSELARGAGGQGDLRSEIERRVSKARGRMTEALDQGVEMSHRAREQMQRGIDYSRHTVSERPLSSLMVVAVGGLVLGLLMSRRD